MRENVIVGIVFLILGLIVGFECGRQYEKQQNTIQIEAPGFQFRAR